MTNEKQRISPIEKACNEMADAIEIIEMDGMTPGTPIYECVATMKKATEIYRAAKLSHAVTVMTTKKEYEELYNQYQKFGAFVAAWMYHNNLTELVIPPPPDDWLNRRIDVVVKKVLLDDGQINVILSFEIKGYGN